MTDVCTLAAAPKPEADDAEPLLSGSTDATVDIKCPVKVKTESDQSRDCLICASRIDEQWYDVYWTETSGGRSPLFAYICRVAEVRLTREAEAGGSVACRTCVELINVLERAEIEYHRLKKSFVEIISENPAFESAPHRDLKQMQVQVEIVKREVEEDGAPASRTRTRGGARARGRNSDDEPLALKKRGRKPGKRKKELREHTETDPMPETAKLDEGRVRKQSHSDSYPVLKDEVDVSGDDLDWAGGAQECDDTDYQPANKKVKSKLRSLLENGHRQKRSTQKTKIKRVSIPVLGVIPAHLIVKDLENTNEWTEFTEQAAVKEAIVRKRKKSTKLQPKVHYPCKECASTFNSLSRLKFHMAKHEAAKAPFICEICGAHYKHKKACDIHVDMHKGISDWKCEECNKLFPSKGALHRHNAIHTGKPNYQCDLCGKSFIHTSSFKMHKLSHTGVKPHACDVCGLALMTRSHLKRHKRIHSGEKRHECPVCGKRFSERYNLLAHQKSHDTPPTSGQPANRKPWQGFRCHLCDKRFERRYMLEKHMEVVHQRIMEKGPPKPRNTMTKLLKAQAAAVSKTSVSPDGTDTPAAGRQQGSTPATSKSASSSAEDASVDVKPLITETPADEDTHDSVAGKSSPQPARPAVPTGESFGTVCLANGAWAAAPYVTAEYTMRIADYPQ